MHRQSLLKNLRFIQEQNTVVQYLCCKVILFILAPVQQPQAAAWAPPGGGLNPLLQQAILQGPAAEAEEERKRREKLEKDRKEKMEKKKKVSCKDILRPMIIHKIPWPCH